MVDSIGELYRRGRGWGYGRVVAAIGALTFPLVENLPEPFWRFLERFSNKNPGADNGR